MKKALLVVVAASLMAASSFAAAKKAAAESQIGFGVKGIIGLENLSGSEITDNSMKVAFGGGVFADIKAGKTLMIQPELEFVTKGCSFTGGSSIDLAYIELPVLVKAKFGEPKSKARPTVFVGPAIGMLMSAKANPGGVDIKDEMNSMNLSVVGGAGVDIDKITVDVRYDLGLSNLVKDAPSGVDIKTGNILLTVGYLFN